MKPDFEIKYLELHWYNQDTLTKVKASMNALRIEYDFSRSVFLTETSIYPKLEDIHRGHLAIRFFKNHNIDNPPYIETSAGGKIYLSLITDPETGFNWWIIKNKWDKERKQWLSIAPNIAGIVHLTLQKQRCEIYINGSDFNQEQLEDYLRTFKNDLWELILDDSSAVTSEAKTSNSIEITKGIISCINNLVNNAEQILKKPKVELREIQSLKQRKFVKPVNRTFMEIATKANHRLLTSRATKPSYNVAENRYVLFALERCYRIIKQIVILAENKSNRYKHTAEKLKNQFNSFSDYTHVNRDMVKRDLEKIRERIKLENWQEKLKKDIIKNGIRLNNDTCRYTLYISILSYSTNQHTGEKDGFFILVWDGKKWLKPKEKYRILSLRDNYQELTSVLSPGMELCLNCEYNLFSTQKCELLILYQIHTIDLINYTAIENAKLAFEKEKNIGINLAKNNWIKPLSKQELDEQEREKRTIINRINFYQKNQNLSAYVYKKVEPKRRALQKIIKQFKSLGISPSSHFPNSMTFVQNPHYQGLHNNYRILRDSSNLSDDDLLISLEEIDAIGLVNMPLLYERWVFIQIILMLKDTFRFLPQSDWKYKIIEAVKTNKTNIEIKLFNEHAKRYITLWYEKTLSNGKRPDFVLDLTWHLDDSDNNSQGPFFKRFVLDAKFYDNITFSKAGGLISKINELYETKNYSEDNNNPVFLIHPCKESISQQVTAQIWGKHSFLGEINILDGEDLPQHNKGAIYLNPIDRNHYADELQRLLGLFLQYKLESSHTTGLSNDRTQAVPICIRCGSTNVNSLRKSTRYKNADGNWVTRKQNSVWLQCKECDQFQGYNHCGSSRCNATRLIKNGLYWSYHSARALEPFNMKCPNCGEWGAW